MPDVTEMQQFVAIMMPSCNRANGRSVIACRKCGMNDEMPRAAAERRLKRDLATARRARELINDPLSLRMLADYISDLERQLHHGDTTLLLDAATLASKQQATG